MSTAGFHITEDCAEVYLQNESGMEFLQLARRLHDYLQQGQRLPARSLFEATDGCKEISREAFDALAKHRMENTGEVSGVFELDFDARTLSALNIMDGWKVYAMQDVANAAEQAFQEAEISEDDRWRIFLDRLDGQELTTPSRLTVQNFYFEDTHPHIHMMVWTDQETILKRDAVVKLRSAMTNSIFQAELENLYIRKDAVYKDVTEAARAVMHELVDRMESVSAQPASIQEKLLELALELRTVSGKKQYAYLKKPLKDMVDSIVDELEKLPEVAAYYAVWNGVRDTLEGYYKKRPRQHNPLSQQKEFRAIKNAIIQEAERLQQQMEQESSQEEEPSPEETSTDASTNSTLADENASSMPSRPARLPTEYLLNSTVRLFHQMGQIFRDNAAPPSNPMGIRIDSKRRKKLMQKRLAMGHKQDDHEQNYGQTLQ